MRRLAVIGIVVVALGFGAVSCGDGGPSVTCVDWDTKKVKKTVTPSPERTYNKKKKRWENGSTPKPYKTTIKTRYCDEWETEPPTPTDS